VSNEKDKPSLPPEARRRGGMDTLFSAAWFDEDAAKSGNTPGGADRAAAAPSSSRVSVEPEAPKKSNTLMFVVIGVVVVLVLGGLACTGVAGVAGAWYYYSMAAVTAG
jgi:hypothetical protein